jgi:hypothetical protein
MLLFTALLLTGCSSDNDTVAVAPDGSPLELKAAVVSGLATRSTTASDNAWTLGDVVTVMSGGTAYSYTVTDAGSGVIRGDITWGSETEKSVTAWSYGGSSPMTTTTPTSWYMATDQGTNDKLQQNDFLYAPATTVTSGGSNLLTFTHEMSKVLVRIICADGSSLTADDVDNLYIKAKNTSTFSYTDGTPSWTAPSTAVTDFTPYAETPSGFLKTGMALLIPQDMSGNAFITFRIKTITDGTTTYKTYTYTPGTAIAKLAGGCRHVYNLMFNVTNLVVYAVKVNDWNASTGGTVIDVSTIPLTATGSWNGGTTGSITDTNTPSGASVITWTKTDADGNVIAVSNIPTQTVTDWNQVNDIGALVYRYTNVLSDPTVWVNGGSGSTTGVSTVPGGADNSWGTSTDTGSMSDRNTNSSTNAGDWTDGGSSNSNTTVSTVPTNTNGSWGTTTNGSVSSTTTSSTVGGGTWTSGGTGTISTRNN